MQPSHQYSRGGRGRGHSGNHLKLHARKVSMNHWLNQHFEEVVLNHTLYFNMLEVFE